MDIPRLTPVEAALITKAYFAARRAGPRPQVAFIEALLDRPSIKRSKRYRRETHMALLGAHCLNRDREGALASARALLDIGFKYAFEAFYMANRLFETFGVVEPLSEMLDRGYRLCRYRHNECDRFRDVISLKSLELSIRTLGSAAGGDEPSPQLVWELESLACPCPAMTESLTGTLRALMSRGVEQQAVRMLAERIWAELWRRQHFHGENHQAELKDLQEIAEQVEADGPNG